MDPNANLKEQLDLVRGILNGKGENSYWAVRLAELVEGMDEWLCAGGFLPERWDTRS